MSDRADAEMHQRACHLMAEALDLAMERREGFLARECDGEPALHERVRELLAHHERGPALQPLIDGAAIASAPLGGDGSDRGTPPTPALPDSIGPFRIVRELGRGSHGVVYEAEQEAPRRRVALKVLQPGWLAASQAGRLEREAAALARFSHAGIAAIHAAGRHESGGGALPWFAMELVEGARLDVHVARGGLDRRRRVELLVQVCDAVEHAHRHGVVHRDLKPANVLVRDDGQVKVVDFGVAALLDPGQATVERMTASGAFVGTLAYLAPEQVAESDGRVDARSDVWSLGVMAYELLTGRLPFDPRDRPLSQALRQLAEFEPVAPARIDPALAGDLDTIVRKAIEKPPERRYAGAAELRDDLARWLAHRPIRARPPSAVDRALKFARRNRVAVGAGAVAVAALVTGVVMLSVGLARATDALRQSEERRTGSLELIASLITRVRQLVDLPGGGKLRDLALADVRAMVDHYQLQRAAADDDPRLLAAWATFLDAEGDLLLRAHQFDEAGERWREALSLRERLAGEPTTATETAIARQRAWSVAQVKLGDVAKERGDWKEARRWYEQVLARDEALVERHPDHAGCLDDLGYGYARLADLALKELDFARATTLSLQRIDYLTRLAARPDARDEWRLQLAEACLYWIEFSEVPRGSVDFRRRAAAATAALDAIAAPETLERRIELLRGGLEMAAVWGHIHLGESEQGLTRLAAVRQRLERLAAAHPDDRDAWMRLRTGERTLSVLESSRGRHDTACAGVAAVVEALRKRVTASANAGDAAADEWFAGHLMQALNDQAANLERAGRTEPAIATLRELLAEVDRLRPFAIDRFSLVTREATTCLSLPFAPPDLVADGERRLRAAIAEHPRRAFEWLAASAAENAKKQTSESLRVACSPSSAPSTARGPPPSRRSSPPPKRTCARHRFPSTVSEPRARAVRRRPGQGAPRAARCRGR